MDESPESNFADKIIRFGFSEALCRVMHRLGITSVCHSFAFFYKEIQERQSGGDHTFLLKNGKAVALREIFEYELDSLQYADGMYSIEELRRQFQTGMRFYAAFMDEKIVSVKGINAKIALMTYLKRPAIRIPEKTIYFNCALTAPAYQSLGIGSKLRNYSFGILYREGYRYCFLVSLPENFEAIKWHRRNGFQKIGDQTYLKINGKEYWWTRLTRLGRRHKYLFEFKKYIETPVISQEARV